MEKYTNREIPDESTMRKSYMNDIDVKTMNKTDLILPDTEHGFRWMKPPMFKVDKVDVQWRYIAIVIIGTLEVDKPGQVYLLNSEVLEKTNHSTITKVFDQSMFLLWPDGIRHDDVM